MSFRLSIRSRDRLKGVHPALVGVIEAAIATSPVDFMVTEGLRSPARQAALVKQETPLVQTAAESDAETE